MKVWKDYTIEDAIVVIEKSMSTIKPETTSFWRKQCPDVVQDFTGFSTTVIKEIKKEAVEMVSGSGSWRNSRANRHHTRGINRRQLERNECFQTRAR